jgi:gliding motility-associated-like protein
LPANGIYQKELYVNVPTNLAAIYTFSLQVVEDGNNCISDVITNNIDTVEVYRKPYADFMLDKKITSLYEPAFFIEETSIDATKWEWDFGDGTTSSLQYPDEHSYTDSGSFLITLKVSNPSGCKDSTTQIATVEKPTSVYIPSAFTPNGDGSNDTFLPKGDGIIEYSITIYNRWGMAIYKSNDITQGWDGTIDGSIPDAMDAYVYLIVVKDVKRHEHIYRGMINLIW